MVHRGRDRFDGRPLRQPKPVGRLVAVEYDAGLSPTPAADAHGSEVRLFGVTAPRHATPERVLAASGLPALRSEFPGRADLRAHALVPRPADRAGEWLVEVLYRDAVQDGRRLGVAA